MLLKTNRFQSLIILFGLSFNCVINLAIDSAGVSDDRGSSTEARPKKRARFAGERDRAARIAKQNREKKIARIIAAGVVKESQIPLLTKGLTKGDYAEYAECLLCSKKLQVRGMTAHYRMLHNAKLDRRAELLLEQRLRRNEQNREKKLLVTDCDEALKSCEIYDCSGKKLEFKW